ncbi:MAG: 2-dehydro-3-deoxygalactonokinase [Rhizobiales bacterium]|nr:2-dehydro-3-deoxygalactonokinase [Hyphomicrobiales bacterium]
MTTAFIAVDWGTSSFRAAAMARDGAVLARVASGEGILKAAARGFEAVLFEEIAAIDAAGAPILLSGMIGSRNGWVEVPYARCPADAAALSAGAARMTVRGRALAFAPGLICDDESGRPDVMRGEETQIFGAVEGDATVVLPGTHSKWARFEGGRVVGFRSYMTGEMFAAMRHHTILGALAEGEADDAAAFADGARAGAADGALSHALFSARTMALTGRLSGRGVASYLSGLLIGAEIADGARRAGPGRPVVVVGEAGLAARYLAAGRALGVAMQAGPADAAFRGLARLAPSPGAVP